MSDYISREAAIDDILVKRLRNRRICIQQSGNLGDFPLLKEAADAIDELSRDLDSMNEANIALYGALPKWISVEERLPEKAGHYIVFVELKRDGQKISAWTQVTWFFGEFILECPEDEECFVATVTHWMPLPEPPKEG